MTARLNITSARHRRDVGVTPVRRRYVVGTTSTHRRPREGLGYDSMSDIFPQNPTLVTLHNAAGMQVTLMDWGATIHSIKVPLGNGTLREMLIGPANPEDYHHQYCYMGATIGRYANRIDKGQFVANGKDYTVGGGKDVVLHGGDVGFDKQRFSILEQQPNCVTFKLHSPDGQEGFPGNFDLIVKYTLGDDGSLRIDYHGTCDQECPACITNHSYFNLNGKHCKVLGHEAMFNAKSILLMDPRSIPTGVVYDVTARTDKVDNFNFTQFKKLAPSGSVEDFVGDENMRFTGGYDHAYIINDYGDITKPCATVKGEVVDGKQVQLEVFTNYPAFQFYSGNAINQGVPDVAIARDDNKEYGPHDGFCIEPEYFPDAPHLKEFTEVNPVVTPKQPLNRYIMYKFTVL